MPRGVYERKTRGMYCRSFYIRKDGSIYVQAGHDVVEERFLTTLNQRVMVPVAGNRTLCGIHVDIKKCGIVLVDWSFEEDL